jgi:hypothetical protein
VLKGALLFELWTKDRHRPTRDVDFLAYGSNDVGRFVSIFQEICSGAIGEDGLTFEIDAIVGERIKEDADYQGIRINFVAYLGNIRIPVQIDLGFGDIVTPAPVQVEYPTLLTLPAPILSGYPRETVVAEKCEAMVKLGMANSRMKDFHDLSSLAALFPFDGKTLARAIAETFTQRKTNVPARLPTAFTAEFYEDLSKRRQWTAFIERNRLYIEPRQLADVVSSVALFVMPVLESLADRRSFAASWPAAGPWTRGRDEHSTATKQTYFSPGRL